MAIVTLLIIFGILALVWGDIGKLGAGLVGIHESRSGMFNLDIMVQAWISVGLLFLFIEWLF